MTLLGHRTDVADLLAGADLAVVTSDWEARQLFAQEALRAGVPLVATAVGGLPELVGDAAALVPPGDVDALDAAVRALLDDPAARAELGRRAPAGGDLADRGGHRRDARRRLRRAGRGSAAARRAAARAPTPRERDTGDAAPTRSRPADRARGGAGRHRARRPPAPGHAAAHRRLRGASPASPGCAGRTSTRRAPRRCGGWPRTGSIGSLSVRSAHRPTCPVDGWLTLGAGNFAAWNGSRPVDGLPVGWR